MEIKETKKALEKQEIKRKYKALLYAVNKIVDSKTEKKAIRKAFNIALDLHSNMRRKSGEPYIYHPIAVAQICVKEMGMGATSIVCALLHDVVEDTEVTIGEIEKWFGKKIASVVEGLTKISGVVDYTQSMQAENFRKIILTLSDDVRVILIKIADRLHNMRTLEHMPRQKQLKIASETLFLYAPLAHRLGLYNIKTELEDLALKYTEPVTYNSITAKLRKTQAVRNRFVTRITLPIKNKLDEYGIKYTIKARTKSIYSIYNKMQKKSVNFEEIYDIFAIRIILEVPPDREKSEIWRTYSIVTDIYRPKPDRLRDWISFPRANGYESLHTTVMSPTGKWVEVQIRSERMDLMAEKGYAAHWKYKEGHTETAIDEWIEKIRELLETKEEEALDFVDAFKLNLYTQEVYVFTPKGELLTMPTGSTALDFAYEIHSEIGNHCLGAKKNNKLVPLSYQLNSGDQLEIITSQKQSPKENWLQFVHTSKARNKIKTALKEEKRKVAIEGRAIFDRKIKRLKYTFTPNDLPKMLKYFSLNNELDFFYKIGKNHITIQQLKDFYKEENKAGWYDYFTKRIKRKKQEESKNNGSKPSFSELLQQKNSANKQLLIGEDLEDLAYKLASCCNPIPGDEVFGFVSVSDGIKIHKTNCPNAINLLSKYEYRIVKAKWVSSDSLALLAGILVKGFDDVGMVNKITRLISNQMKVNMRSLNFDTEDGLFEGKITVFVSDTRHLKDLMGKLQNLSGVINVERWEDEQQLS